MRYMFLVLFLAMPSLAQEKKKDPPLKPIEEVKPDLKEPVEYGKHIEPIFADKCFVCHSGNVIESKFDMSTHASVMKGGKRGAVVVPGKAAESFLYKVSGHREKPVMPLKGEDPLTPKELALVKAWIDDGAKAPTMARERRKITLTAPPDSVKPVRAVAVHAGVKRIAVGRGTRIDLYDTEKFEHVAAFVDPALKAAHLSLVESLAFSPDGKTLASGSFQEVNLWNVEDGKIRRKLSGFADKVVALGFSGDGKLLATGGGAPTEDGELKVFDPADGRQILDIKPAHSDTVFGVAFSPDNTKLATCGADKFVKVFEIPGGKLLKSFEGHTHHVMDVAWKPDGKALASAGADNNVKVWDYEKGEQQRTIPAHGKQVTKLVFLGKTPTFATVGGDANVKQWNVDNGGAVRTHSGNSDYLYALAVGEDGKLIVIGGEEGVARVYTPDNSAPKKDLLPPGEAKKEEPKKK